MSVVNMGVSQSTRHLLPGIMTSNTSVPSTYNLVSRYQQEATIAVQLHTHKDRNNARNKALTRNNQDSDSISRRSLVPFLTRLRSASFSYTPYHPRSEGCHIANMPPRQPKPDAIHPSILTITTSPPAHRHLIRFHLIPSSS